MPHSVAMIDASRFVGCLLGECLGDTLGAPVEGHSGESASEYVNVVLRGGRAGTFGRPPFPFGQVTDDSQLAYELLESTVQHGDFVPEDYAARIADLFARNQVVGRGRSTEEAAHRLARGVPWDEAGTPAPAAGNGTAMRVAPVGLVFADGARRREVARMQGVITHRDPRAGAGAVVIAESVAWVLSAPPDPRALTAHLAEVVGEGGDDLREALLRIPGWLALDPDEVLREVRAVGLPPDHRERWPGISPFVIPSVLWSLYAFLRSPDDYWETICAAIAVGGDVDTTAAMAGAISGAYLGESALPSELVARIHDQERWSCEDARALALRAHAMAPLD